MGPAVYLDYNATVPIRPEVADAMAAALEVVGNPSSVHRFGRAARRLVEEAREKVAALVGARPAEVVLTSGGTEANNLALEGTGRARRLVSAIEHPSVLQAAGAELLPVDGDGVLDLTALNRMLAADRRPALVSAMLANNETGVIEPVAEAARIAHACGAILHSDAVQAAGRIAVDVRELGVDLLTLSAHKIGGPQGCGALVARQGVPLAALLRGGGQERGRRAGTENLAAIVGFGVAAELAGDRGDQPRLARLRDDLEARLRHRLPGLRVFGAGTPRLANTSCFAAPGIDSATQVMSLDLAGVAVSAGSACSSGKVRASHVLRAMGVPAEEAGSAIRVSFGWRSEAGHVGRLVEAWSALMERRAEALPAA